MFASLARMVPNIGLRTIFSAVTRASAPSTVTVVPASTGCVSSPFGPLTRTSPSATATVTPPGIATGSFPTLDMAFSLPDVTDDFAAEPRLAGLAVAHHPFGGGHDAGAQPAQNPGERRLPDVHAPARGADAPDAGDHVHVVGGVLEVQAQDALAAVLDELDVVQIAFAQQRA